MVGASSSSSTMASESWATRALLVFCMVISAAAVPYRSKGKGRDAPQLVYDQKQTGDYNIQLHLKDFQIIALLGDDTLSDYDYNYDYADFTIKPSSSSSASTTSKTSTTTTKTPISSSTEKPEALITTHSPPTSVTINSHSNSANPDRIKKPISPPASPEEEGSTGSVTEQTSPTTILSNDIIISSSASPTLRPSPSSSIAPLIESMTPGKIKVQIVDALGTSPIGIVPGEDVQSDGGATILQGEVSNYRRCANGFTRDKKGRCRRVRKPGSGAHQLPFGFGRIASSLATRLRLPNSEPPAPGSETSD